jgi:predicted Zn-dependent peptidase
VVVVAAAGGGARAADGVIRRSQLDHGLRVVTESVPGLHSVTVGAWVGVGSRDEQADEWGASHFLEHLLFKGTEERSAREIAETVEAVGGDMNAFTTQEQTAFHVRVPAAHLELATEILGDVVWRPAFRAGEVESERSVILEEIGMRDDTPDDLVHDLLGRALFPEHPLGREVIGSRESITAMPRDRIAAYHARHYRPGNVVWAAAGAVDHESFVDLVARAAPAGPAAGAAGRGPADAPADARAVIDRATEQVHLLVGMRALSQLDPDRYALAVLNQIVGGGMASRLFQEVREERGLAYSVYSYRAAFSDAGYFAVYAGTAPERARETLDVIHAQLDRLVADGSVPERELDAARSHLVGSMALALETSASRMRRIGSAEIVEGDVPEIDEIIRRVEAVDRDAVARVVDRVVRDAPRSLAVVGPSGALP